MYRDVWMCTWKYNYVVKAQFLLDYNSVIKIYLLKIYSNLYKLGMNTWR